MRLQGRVAIVTGGGHGIGRAYVLGLAREGARVAIAELDAAAAERVANEVAAAGGEALAIPTDVSDEASTRNMARVTAERFGGIDILVNNASIFATIPMSRVGFEQISVEEWDRLMAVNLKGPWLCARAVVPYMRQRGKGKIINIASGTVLDGGGGTRAHYVASKAGVVGLTRTLACELGKDNICVNTLAPGSTLSEENPTEDILRFRQAAAATRVLKRVQRPEDLVGTVLFLASDDSDFMTGQMIVCDGGDNLY
ncbi:MAG TPA: SDR family oxidoreductase [Chloroflexota bacterium]|jgi:3-oxoacyl-[acyl-carrier protein] reductase|nr:SDR family oxidoreductase [Chloroflexota bacterium]